MAAPRTTVWDLEPHTRAKHEILKRYLQAWTPILTQGGFPEIMYIDGFAGPGRYSNGEDGSPTIALRAALEHRDRIGARIRFEFVEEDEDRAGVLREVIAELDTPDQFHIEVHDGTTFETALEQILESYQGRRLPPTFAYIDPFGWSGVPFPITQEILRNRSCEVMVNFMYEEINRFLGHSDQERNFDSFFGTDQWREGIQHNDPRMRNRFLHDLYHRRLRDISGARYVRSFEMRNERDVVDYYLFYATNNMLGLKKMKEAMWRVDESGEFRFSDATDPNQAVLFLNEPRLDMLRHQLLDQFGGCVASVGEVEEYILAETAFRETHYKRQILRPLELAEPAVIEVIDPPPGRRRGTFPDSSMRLRFR